MLVVIQVSQTRSFIRPLPVSNDFLPPLSRDFSAMQAQKELLALLKHGSIASPIEPKLRLVIYFIEIGIRKLRPTSPAVSPRVWSRGRGECGLYVFACTLPFDCCGKSLSLCVYMHVYIYIYIYI